MASAKRPNLDPSDIPNFVKTMRAMMGWKNEEITQTEIANAYKNIEGTNGPIPLRIYTPS
ncbi:hypothetical protein QFZ81_001166 [Paenibacillus sp. V4I9]|uniref:hypothetical protein n=1 Tax=Paenibacillus sp. V4I9 TaxID=3042308 RepID=UPI0027844D58|nr:hypothetical protein [Paenibacillus sp. V4I9]MDQ0886078.1 hypothetical protein [Paenibacillus sp. V4I9]